MNISLVEIPFPNVIITYAEYKTLNIWKKKSKVIIQTLKLDKEIKKMNYSEDNKMIILMSNDCTLCVVPFNFEQIDLCASSSNDASKNHSNSE